MGNTSALLASSSLAAASNQQQNGRRDASSSSSSNDNVQRGFTNARVELISAPTSPRTASHATTRSSAHAAVSFTSGASHITNRGDRLLELPLDRSFSHVEFPLQDGDLYTVTVPVNHRVAIGDTSDQLTTLSSTADALASSDHGAPLLVHHFGSSAAASSSLATATTTSSSQCATMNHNVSYHLPATFASTRESNPASDTTSSIPLSVSSSPSLVQAPQQPRNSSLHVYPRSPQSLIPTSPFSTTESSGPEQPSMLSLPHPTERASASYDSRSDLEEMTPFMSDIGDSSNRQSMSLRPSRGSYRAGGGGGGGGGQRVVTSSYTNTSSMLGTRRGTDSGPPPQLESSPTAANVSNNDVGELLCVEEGEDDVASDVPPHHHHCMQSHRHSPKSPQHPQARGGGGSEEGMSSHQQQQHRGLQKSDPWMAEDAFGGDAEPSSLSAYRPMD